MAAPLEYGKGDERSYDLYYQHSGYTPPSSMAIAGVGGVAVGVVSAFIYAYAIEYIPIIKLRFIMTAVFGAVVGGATAFIAKKGKVRSLAVGVALVGVVTLVAYYFAWVFWIKATFDRIFGDDPSYSLTLGKLIFSPKLFWYSIRLINENGTYKLSKSDKEATQGMFLTLIWVAEFGAIFVMALVCSVPQFRSEMFCETCERWCGNPVVLRNVAAGDATLAKQTLEAHDFSYLNSLGEPSPLRFWSLEYHRCTNCKELHALSVYNHTLTVDKKGVVKSNVKKTLVEKLLLAPQEAEVVVNPPGPAGNPPEGVA